MSCTSTPYGDHLHEVSLESHENCRRSSCHKLLCISYASVKMCLSPRADNSAMPGVGLKIKCNAHLHLMVIICMKFHWNPLKTVEVVRVTRIGQTDRPTNTVTPIYPPKLRCGGIINTLIYRLQIVGQVRPSYAHVLCHSFNS